MQTWQFLTSKFACLIGLKLKNVWFSFDGRQGYFIWRSSYLSCWNIVWRMPLILPLCISEFVLLELSLFLISLMFLVILALHTVTHLSKNSGCTIKQCNSLLRALYSFYMCSTMSLFLEKVYFIYVKYTSNKPMLIVSDSCV